LVLRTSARNAVALWTLKLNWNQLSAHSVSGSHLSSIFIQLASYHDYELPGTILNALEMSSGEHDITFGVHHNYYEVNDISLPDLPNLKVAVSKAPDNLGIGVSRAIAHSFYAGEDYYMQVDAHTRFIDYYKSLGFDKPLLTTYPRNYWYTDGVIGHDKGWGVSCISFEEDPNRFVVFRAPTQTAAPNPAWNVFSRSISAGSIFTVGPFFVPNTTAHSIGEEILIAARAFTRGYDILIPRENQLSHLYYDHDKPHANGRRLVWKDFPEEASQMETVGSAYVKDLFLNKVVSEQGLGEERTLEEFEVFSGLDFATGVVITKDVEVTSEDTWLAGVACPVGVWTHPLAQ
jgi:hypothetical protein